MRRACEIRTAGTWNAETAIDRVVLDAHERHRRRIALTGERATAFLPVLPQPLLEIAAASPHELARLAWHIGNRHTEVQVVGDRLRIRRDRVLEEMLRGLGARLTAIEAPFDPEHGAYGHANNHDHEH